MKKFTQEEFDNFPIEDGVKQCPSGDYSDIQAFGEHCSFSNDCIFGESSNFGNWSSFGSGCSFGAYCSFEDRCSFGEWSRFGEWCSFGECCSFGEWCSFGEHCGFGECCGFGEWCSFGECCSFGEHCRFGKRCSFGECCSFGSSCICEFGEFKKMLSVGGFGSEGRTTYFFLLLDDQISVRCGCFAGTLEEWEKQVKSEHGDSCTGQAYLALVEPIKLQFQISLAENEN